MGRQPWTVYGLLRTYDSASPIAAPAVATSLALFMIVYLLVFGAGTFYIVRLMGRPVAENEQGPDPSMPQRAAGITPGVAMAASDSLPQGEEARS